MVFKETEKQKEATRIMKAHTHTMLFGGSRSGKTFKIVRLIVIRCLRMKSDHLICRHRYNHVKASIWNKTFLDVMKICFPGVTHKNKTQDGYILFPNGSRIWFVGLDSDERTEKVLGNEFSTIYAGECSQINWEAILILHTRLAETSGLTLRFFYDCNPPSMSHWTYKVFIKGVNPNSDAKMDISNYGHLLMNPSDNVENLPQVYLDILKTLPPKQRQRFWEGRFMSDVEGALWSREMIDNATSHITSYTQLQTEVGIRQVFIGVDPSIEHDEGSDLCGIVVAAQGNDNLFYIVDDKSLITSPNGWARTIINTYDQYEGDKIIVEKNQGGSMVATILRSNGYTGSIKEVHASHAKHARAQPVVDLYEQGKVRHLDTPRLTKLEEELLSYVPATSKKSPDRLDALVWAMSFFTGKKDTVSLLQNADWDQLRRASRGRR
jgi:phage terminase large subunit-like protein